MFVYTTGIRITFRIVKTYRLHLQSNYIHPMWRIGDGKAVVQNNGVTLDGLRLTVKFCLQQTASIGPNSNEPALIPDGTEVVVWIGTDGHFVCATAADLAHDAAQRAEAELQRVEANRLKAEAQRHAAKAFNQSIKLPVDWTPAIKDVLSGLSARSNGDGTKANTVVHIRLAAAIATGRLAREKGDFLCTAKGGSNGKQWANQPNNLESMVTCKQCLKLAARWAR